jgi:hypothetical protein
MSTDFPLIKYAEIKTKYSAIENGVLASCSPKTIPSKSNKPAKIIMMNSFLVSRKNDLMKGSSYLTS